MEYDIVWCATSHEEQALAIVRRLSRTEIAMRGLWGMQGLRVYPSAPIPHDEKGTYCGATGECVMTNWLGSITIATAPTSIVRNDPTERQTIQAAALCRRIDVLERDADERPLLVGGLLRDEVFNVPDEAYQQARNERANYEAARVQDADASEVAMAKLASFAKQYIARPIGALAACASRYRWTRPLAVVLAILATAVLWGTEIPAVGYIVARAKYRHHKKWKRLAASFSPFNEARSAVAQAALPKISIQRRI